MSAWSLFSHSFRLVIDNLPDALRLSLVPYLGQVAFSMYQYANPPQVQEINGESIPVVSLTYVVLAIVALLGSLWIAVAWHRYVLENERPTGWVPRFSGGRMLGYLGRSILLGLVTALALIPPVFALSFIIFAAPALAPIFGPGLVALGAFIFFRLGVILPAGTIDRRLSLKEAWKATSSGSSAILGLALFVFGASFLAQLPAMLGDGGSSVISLVYSLVIGWFATLIGSSVLTTLYGHYVEGRAID